MSEYLGGSGSRIYRLHVGLELVASWYVGGRPELLVAASPALKVLFTHRRAPVCLTTTIMMTIKRKTNPPTPKMTKHHEGIPYSLYSPDTFAVVLGLASSLIFTLATVHCRTDDVILILTFTVEVSPEHQAMVWLSWHSRIWNIERKKITELLIFKNMDNLVYN